MTESSNHNIEASIKRHLDFKERYSELRPIGAGGIGAVFQVKDNKLDKLVAIKVLHGNVKPKSVIRFQKEARALSMMNHRYILGVLDFQSSNSGDLFLITEYVDGTDLEQFVAKHGPLPFEDVVKYSIQLCDALAHAHAKGVVHRDLKPGNVMIDQQNNVRILDFGIAKLLTDDDQTGTISSFGVPIGSPAYMSPEQVRGGDTDERTDIFGLGLLIYVMAAGRSPFDADQVLDYYQNLIGKPPPSLRLWIGESDVAHKLDAIVAKAMSSDPADRYQTMDEMRTALSSLISDPIEVMQVTHGPVSRAKESSKPYLLILLVAVAGLSLIALFYTSTGTSGTADSGTAKNPKSSSPAQNTKATPNESKSASQSKYTVQTAFGLENFTFASESVSASDLESLGSETKRLSLRELRLDPAMVAALPSLEVEALDLTKTNVTDADMKFIAKMKNLVWLRLDNTGVTSDGIKNLEPLKDRLGRIDLDACRKIDDKAIACIVDYWPNLRALQISDTSVKKQGLKDLVKLKRVDTLWLSSLPLSDDDVKSISQLNLVGLDVSCCKKLTDESVKVLIPKKSMQYLEVTDCPLIHSEIARAWERAHPGALLRGGKGDAARRVAEDVYYPPPAEIK